MKNVIDEDSIDGEIENGDYDDFDYDGEFENQRKTKESRTTNDEVTLEEPVWEKYNLDEYGGDQDVGEGVSVSTRGTNVGDIGNVDGDNKQTKKYMSAKERKLLKKKKKGGAVHDEDNENAVPEPIQPFVDSLETTKEDKTETKTVQKENVPVKGQVNIL